MSPDGKDRIEGIYLEVSESIVPTQNAKMLVLMCLLATRPQICLPPILINQAIIAET